MTSAALLRKAKPINVREAQARLSQLIGSKMPSLVMSHGKPVSFLIPYEEMLDLLEMLEDLKGRSEYETGKAIPAERLFVRWGSECPTRSYSRVNASSDSLKRR